MRLKKLYGEEASTAQIGSSGQQGMADEDKLRSTLDDMTLFYGKL